MVMPPLKEVSWWKTLAELTVVIVVDERGREKEIDRERESCVVWGLSTRVYWS